MFVNSGAEAVENAIKIAKSYTKRPSIIAFDGGFHGRTLLTMTLTSKVKPYKHECGPFAPEVYKAPLQPTVTAVRTNQSTQNVIWPASNILSVSSSQKSIQRELQQ